MEYQKSYRVKKVLTKDVMHKKLSGVCGGIAKYYNVPRIVVRVAAVLALFTLPVITGVAYVVAALLMPNR